MGRPIAGRILSANMESNDVIIAGAGIGGLITALSLHQAGVEVQVYEAVDEVRALGVGINLLPHAVRELDALGLLERLASEAVASTTLAYFTKRGQQIWSEDRGVAAGYRWPQLSIHRGTLQKILYDAAVERIGAERIHTAHQLVSFINVYVDDSGDATGSDGRVSATFNDRRAGRQVDVSGAAMIASDGIHSAARAQCYPEQGPPLWNGALLWRGLAECEPILDGRTMIWAGHPRQKFVGYPIADLPGGRQVFNFIAELRYDERELAEQEDWNRPGNLDDFLPEFESWRFEWLDVPSLVRSSSGTFLFPMVDRDPVGQWTFGRVTLLGDAAHPMYPIGSNGASQAILDARTLAGCVRSYPGDWPRILQRYDEVRRPATSAIVLANRGQGPELPMTLVEERAPDGFDDINDVITPAEIAEVTDGYRRTAGFALGSMADGVSLADKPY